MNRRDFVILSLRLFAIYLLFQGFNSIYGGALVLTFYKFSWLHLASILAPAIIYFILGFILFRCSQNFAGYFLPDESRQEIASLDSKTIAVIAFGAVGLFHFVGLLPGTIRLALEWTQILQAPNTIAENFSKQLGPIIGILLQLILSFALIINAHRFTEWWWHKEKLPE